MDWEFLQKTAIFQGMTAEEIRTMLRCLRAEIRTFGRDSRILQAGDRARRMGLVLSGRVQIGSDDPWGNHSILDSVGPGQVFAETYACVPDEPMMVDVMAMEDSRILLLDGVRALQSCDRGCPQHIRLIRNLLVLSARKNLSLSRRIFHTAPKSIRGRLLAYLAFQAQRQGKNEFDIPFNRQQLADYLGVDRSAMSAELGKMRAEGLLETRRNHFVLLQPDGLE